MLDHADKLEAMRDYFQGNPDLKVWEKPEEDDDGDNAQNPEAEEVDSLADTEDLEEESKLFFQIFFLQKNFFIQKKIIII